MQISKNAVFVEEAFIFVRKASSEVTRIVSLCLDCINPCSKKDFFPQRIWKVLPSASYLIHKVIVFFFPSYQNRFSASLKALELLKKKSFSLQEKEIVSAFFKQITQDPSWLHPIRACANKEHHKMILFIQAILNRVDEKPLEMKLREMQEFLSCAFEPIEPLTAREIGIIQFGEERKTFLANLQEQGVEGIDQLLVFWTKMADLQKHPVMIELAYRTSTLLDQQCLGFVLSRENINQFQWNLKEDALRFLTWGSFGNYLFTGNPGHVGFLFPKEGNHFFSHINAMGFHEIIQNKMSILYPSLFLFKFNIRPLLPTSLPCDQSDLLQKIFTQALQEEVSLERTIAIESPLAGVQSYFLGKSTPFWDLKKIETIQQKELCTGLTTKTVYQAFLKILPKLEELGFTKDQIVFPFAKDQHVGRMTVLTFLKHFQEKGMIEFVEDPLLKVLIEPGALRDYMGSWLK